MNKESIHTKSGNKASHKPNGVVKFNPEGSWEKLAIVAGATGGGLLAAMLIGVGPVAIAGAAGYLAYRELGKKQKKAEATA